MTCGLARARRNSRLRGGPQCYGIGCRKRPSDFEFCLAAPLTGTPFPAASCLIKLPWSGQFSSRGMRPVDVAVATSREDHRSPISGREGQHRLWGRGQLIPSQWSESIRLGWVIVRRLGYRTSECLRSSLSVGKRSRRWRQRRNLEKG
jgi:hypothetical protein